MELLQRLHTRLAEFGSPEQVRLFKSGPAKPGIAAGNFLTDRVGRLVVLNLDQLKQWAETGDTAGVPQLQEDIRLLRDLAQQLLAHTQEMSATTGKNLSAALVAVGQTNDQLQNVRRQQQDKQADSKGKETALRQLIQDLQHRQRENDEISNRLDSMYRDMQNRQQALDKARRSWNPFEWIIAEITDAINSLADLINDKKGEMQRNEREMQRVRQEIQHLEDEHRQGVDSLWQIEQQLRKLEAEHNMLQQKLSGLEQQQKALAQRVVLVENVYSFLLEMHEGLSQLKTHNVKSLLRKLSSPVQYYDLNGREETCTFNEALERIVREAGAFLMGSGPLQELPMAEVAAF